MNSQRIAIVIVVLGLLGFGGVLTWKVSLKIEHNEALAAEARARAQQAKDVPPPALAHPQPGPATEDVRLTGTLKPDADVNLAFKLPGRVIEVAVKRGDVVQAGQLLARIDDRDLDAQAAQAQAGMQAARAQKNLAVDALRRSQNLEVAGAASQQQVVMAGGQANLGSASIAQASASARYVEVMRQETRLVAPIDGVVVMAPTAPGSFAAPGVPLFRIERLARLRFVGHVSDRDAPRVLVGAKLSIETDSGLTAIGKVDVMVPSLDPATRRVPIEGILENPDGKLLSGTFVDARIEAKAVPSLLVSRTAVLTGDTPAVLVVGPDNKLVRREVSVVRTEAGMIHVTKGLTAEDAVVVQPGASWREGDTLPHAATPANVR